MGFHESESLGVLISLDVIESQNPNSPAWLGEGSNVALYFLVSFTRAKGVRLLACSLSISQLQVSVPLL